MPNVQFLLSCSETSSGPPENLSQLGTASGFTRDYKKISVDNALKISQPALVCQKFMKIHEDSKFKFFALSCCLGSLSCCLRRSFRLPSCKLFVVSTMGFVASPSHKEDQENGMKGGQGEGCGEGCRLEGGAHEIDVENPEGR